MIIRKYRWAVYACVIVAALGCGDGEETGDGELATDAGGDATADAGADAVDVAEPAEMPSDWTVVVSPGAPEAVRIAADDLDTYLSQMGRQTTFEESEELPQCDSSRGVVALVGDGLAEAALDADPSDEEAYEQTWRIEETRCEGGALVELSGGGLLGRQYAAYEWLHRLGVRFFHPEEEFVPESADWSAEPLMVEHTPAFTYRSVSLHLTHPLELGDVFREQNDEYREEGKRFIDWQIKNGASYGTEGVPLDGLRDYGVMRGLPTNAGFKLHETQQGAQPVIDPDDPRSFEEQVAEAIDAEMGDDPDNYPDFFSFGFNPSEFTEIPDVQIVDEITYVAEYFAQEYPDTILLTTNHGTAGEPTENYGVRFYDLPMFAPPNLGVKVHTLMFYDLFRPAPVYGNENFRFLYDFMVSEYPTRRLWHFPEAAWWLTFDIAVPLYLPITIEARSRDIDGIAFMLDGKLDGHRVFGTGHEWGYWQNEYCSFRMAADLDYDWRSCLSDITRVTGEARGEVQAVLERLVSYQERDLIYGDVLRWVVGTDRETELADSIGIGFHPLPPKPEEILNWDADKVDDFQRRVAPGLKRMEDDYMALVARLDAVAESVPDAGRPWFDEIYDGIEASALRARHARQAYGAMVTLRESQLRFDSALADRAEQLLADAKETTDAALAVIHRREEGYRYAPLSRSIAGGAEGTEDDNWTIYDYRYLNRTHHGFYYTLVNERAEQAFAGSGELVEFGDAIQSGDEALDVRVTSTDLSAVEVDFGDGTVESGTEWSHSYAAPDVYPVVVSGQLDGGDFEKAVEVARVLEETHSGFSAEIVEPEGVDLIEPVLPAITFGPIDQTRLALGFGTDESGDVTVDLWEPLDLLDVDQGYQTRPKRMIVPVVDRGSGSIEASLTVEGGQLTVAADGLSAELSGELSTDAVIATVVSVGGFDESGARSIVANMLGYTPQTLPERVPFLLNYDFGPAE